jgi:hypothetical protein
MFGSINLTSVAQGLQGVGSQLWKKPQIGLAIAWSSYNLYRAPEISTLANALFNSATFLVFSEVFFNRSQVKSKESLPKEILLSNPLAIPPDFSTLPEELIFAVITQFENLNMYQMTTHLSLVCRQWSQVVKNFKSEEEKPVTSLLSKYQLFENLAFPNEAILSSSIKVRGNHIISAFTTKEYINYFCFYDIESKEQKVIKKINCFYKTRFYWLSNNKIIINAEKSGVNAYNLDAENELKFDKKLLPISASYITACDEHKANIVFLKSKKAVFYSVNGNIITIPDSSNLKNIMYKNACFVGKRLIASLCQVNPPLFDFDNGQYLVRSFDPSSGENVVVTFQTKITHMVGDENTLVVAGEDYLQVLNPYDLKCKLNSESDIAKFKFNDLWDLKLKDGRIILKTGCRFGIFGAQSVAIFDAETGRSILETKNCSCLKISGNFAAMVLNKTVEEIVATKNLKSSIIIRNLQTKKIIDEILIDLDRVPTVFKFKVRNEKNPYLIAAFRNGEIKVWKKQPDQA